MDQSRGKTAEVIGEAIEEDYSGGSLAPSRLAQAVRSEGDKIAFFRGFVAHPKDVGSVIPSSSLLERRLVRVAEVSTAKVVVELGPGTGGTTRALLRAMRPDARLLAIELNSGFHSRLKRTIRDRRLALQLGSAENLVEYLREWQLLWPEVILSGIPFSTMDTSAGELIAGQIATCLSPGGRFVAYQVRSNVTGFISPHLGTPERSWELLNVPPMRVLRWSKSTS